MENYQELVSTIALTMGVGWASGINLYAALLVLGVGGATGNVALPEQLQVLQSPLVIFAAGAMYLVEFFADKVPGVDTGWDGLHTFIRLPAGAMLAAGAVGDVTPALELAAGIMGGTLAAGSHVTKAGTRILINTSPEPVTNWTASITEDIAVFGGLWTALNHPWIFLGLLALFIVSLIWLLPKLWRGIRAVLRKLGQLLGLVERKPAAEPGQFLPADADRLEQLDRLKSLHERGALNDEEFAREKQRILGDWAKGSTGSPDQ